MFEVTLATSCLPPMVLLDGVPLPPTITFLCVNCRRRLAVDINRCTTLRIQLPQRLKLCRCGRQTILPLALQRVIFALLRCIPMRPLPTPRRNLPMYLRSRPLLPLLQFSLLIALLPPNVAAQVALPVTGSSARLTPNSIWTLWPPIFPHRRPLRLDSLVHVLPATILLGPPWPMHPP